ncbi:MAG: T9SS type A sorting domain-containing protein [Bacteroidota bacterium]
MLALVGVPSATAQVVYDNFDDGNVDNTGAFAGGAENTGAGTGPTDGLGGDADTGLNLGIDPGSGGGFAGAFVTAPGGVFDATGQEYFTFYIRPSVVEANLPLTLEIVLQEDINGDGMFDGNGGGPEDELRTTYRLDADMMGFEFVQIPLATFVDGGGGADDGVDLSKILNVVYVFGGIPAGPAFAVSFDEIVFRDGPVMLDGAAASYDNFDDGNVDNTGAFAGGAENTGAGTGPTDGLGGDADTGLNLGIDPGSGGGFAGAFVTAPGGVFDATGQEYFTFYIRPSVVEANLPLTLEIVLQEDINGDGMFDGNGGGPEDELRTTYRLDADMMGFEFVQIPLATFVDGGGGADDGVDLSKILNVVYVFGGIPAGPAFAVSFDEIAFVTGTPVSNEPADIASAFSLSAAYPNPFQTSARVDLTLDRAEAVRVAVYDVLGRQVAVLHEGTLSAQTLHSFSLDARGLSSGLYLYRVTGESFSATRRVILN